MCLAYPAKVIEIRDSEGKVELAGNQYPVALVLVPEVQIGQYVLVHAGYAIQIIDAEVARETWEIFSRIEEEEAREDKVNQP